MPYKIISESDEFWVQNTQTGRRMNKKPLSKRKARRYQMALYANESKNLGGTMKATKHGGDFTAKEQDHLQAIHNHSEDLGAQCGGQDEEMTKHLKHGDFSLGQKQDKIQAMHDHAQELGAACDVPEENAAKRFKSFKDYSDFGMPVDIEDNPPDDIRQAAQAIVDLCYLLESEDEEPDDLKKIGDLVRGLCVFIEGELQEGEAGEDGDDAAKKHRLSIKAPAKDGADSDYLVVDKDGQHLRVKKDGKPDHGLMGGAWAALHGGYRGNKYDGGDKEGALSKLTALYKSEGMDTPESKSMDLSYIKSLGIQFPAEYLAVKYIGRNQIKHFPFLWGNPNLLDVETDYFTKDTDFFDSYYGKSPKPLTWDHAQDKQYKGNLVIGQTTDWGDDEVGRWAISVITLNGEYRKMIDKMIDLGILGSSSDSAPQYVERESRGKSTWIKRWPWIATSLTPTPAEPRQIGQVVLKSLGALMPDASDSTRREREAILLSETLRLNNFRIKQGK